MAQVLSGQAPAIARPRVKRAATKTKPAHTGKRHAPAKKKKSKKKADEVQCWTRRNASGEMYKNCAKKAKPKPRGKGKPLIARTNQLVPGITAPIYGRNITVRQGAATQRGIQLRRPGGGAQPRSFVQLPPRSRRPPARFDQ